jgi:sulfur carrier protein
VNVVVNGEARAVEPSTTVNALVLAVAGQVKGTAVAVNGEVVPRGSWPTTLLADDDRVEVLTARAGG